MRRLTRTLKCPTFDDLCTKISESCDEKSYNGICTLLNYIFSVKSRVSHLQYRRKVSAFCVLTFLFVAAVVLLAEHARFDVRLSLVQYTVNEQLGFRIVAETPRNMIFRPLGIASRPDVSPLNAVPGHLSMQTFLKQIHDFAPRFETICDKAKLCGKTLELKRHPYAALQPSAKYT